MEKFRVFDPLSFTEAPTTYSHTGVGYLALKNIGDGEVGVFICNEYGEEVGGCNICTFHPTGRIEVHASINSRVQLPDLNRHRAFVVRENR